MGNFLDHSVNITINGQNIDNSDITHTMVNNAYSDEVSVSQPYFEVLDKVFSTKFKSVNITNDFAQLTSKIELTETEPLKMCLELYNKILENMNNNINSKTRRRFRQGFVKPKFGIESVIDKSNKIKTAQNERTLGDLTLYPIPKIITSLNKSNITLQEYNDSFDRELLNKKDMFGISKKCLAKLADYIKLRIINIFNDIYSNPASLVSQISIGRACYIYKVAKKGPLDNIDSFRRILVIPNIVSQFHRILNSRLDTFMRHNMIIDTNIQKGGISGIKYGMIQQIYKIKHIISCANTMNKSCAVMFVDITDAYGSLSLNRLYQILETYSINKKFIDYVREYYSHLKYFYGDNKRIIDWEGGLIQGCSLSALLFITALNHVLTYINNTMGATHGFSGTKSPIMMLAYIDDIAIVCENSDKLKTTYLKLKELLATIGLSINMSKCAKMTINCEMKDIDNIPETKIYKYLGENISSDGTPSESYLAFIRSLTAYLIKLNVTKRIDNVERMKQFKTLILPFIKRKLVILYDISIKQRASIMHIIKYYVNRWNDDNEDIEVLVNIYEIIDTMDDTYIKNNFNADDYECIKNTKLLIHDKNVNYTYDDMHEKELVKVDDLDDINDFNDPQNSQNDVSSIDVNMINNTSS